MCSKFMNSILDMRYSKGDAKEQCELRGEAGVEILIWKPSAYIWHLKSWI